ncbi:MAG: OmpA family protein [Phycisphaerales bacterium]
MARMVTIRSRSRRLTLATAGLGLFALATGCVSQQEYDNLADANLANSERLAELRAENSSLQREIEQRQGRISDLEGQIGGLEQTRNSMRDQIADAQRRYAEFQNRLNNISLSGLDPETDRRLRELAASNPQLMTYDADKGVIRFTSDLTFASGSATVRDSAKGALRTLASVLLESEASGYDIMVIGHTDNQAISASRDRFPTNRHLSTYRAIAVSESLQTAGLPAARVLVSGWGQFDPVVANNATGGTAANRRVEVFLMPSGSFRTGSANLGAASTGTAPAQAQTSSGGGTTEPIVK